MKLAAAVRKMKHCPVTARTVRISPGRTVCVNLYLRHVSISPVSNILSVPFIAQSKNLFRKTGQVLISAALIAVNHI